MRNESRRSRVSGDTCMQMESHVDPGRKSSGLFSGFLLFALIVVPYIY